MKPHIREALEYVSACYSTFKLTPAVAMVWEDQLGSFERTALLNAVRGACGAHTFGPPAPAHVLEWLVGRVERIQAPVTDHWNRKVLKADGTPAYTVEERRVFPDGHSEPLSLPSSNQHEELRSSEGPGLLGNLLDDVLGEA